MRGIKTKTKPSTIKTFTRTLAQRGFGALINQLQLEHLLPSKHRAMLEHYIPAPSLFARTLLDLGPGFVEAGRIASQRVDVVPESYHDVLHDLPYQPQARELGDAKKLLAHELGRAIIKKEFTYIHDTPHQFHLLGASYRAVLSGNRRALVLINDPAEIKKMQDNFAILEWLLHMVGEKLDKKNALIWESVWEELLSRTETLQDLTKHAGKIEVFAHSLESIKEVRVPDVCWQLTRKNILTYSWQKAPTLEEAATGARVPLAKTKIAALLARSFIQQYGSGGYYLLRPSLRDMQIDREGRLVFTNIASMGYIDENLRTLFIVLLYGLLKKSYLIAAKAILTIHYAALHEDHELHGSGLALRGFGAGDTIAEKVRRALHLSWQGNISVPLHVSMAAESVYHLEEAVHELDEQADFDAYLLEAIQHAVPKIFGVKEGTPLSAIARRVFS